MRIGIIENNLLFKRELDRKIHSSDEYDMILSTNTVEEFQNLYKPYMKLDIALVNIHFPGKSGFEAIQFLKRAHTEVQVIMLTDEEDATTILRAFRNGADGYLLKYPFPDIISELDLISKGHSPLSPSIARKVINYFNPPKSIFSKKKGRSLTTKEIQTIQLVVEGMTHKAIADHMGISVNGVYYHIKNIYKKLNLNSKTELIRMYLEGMIE